MLPHKHLIVKASCMQPPKTPEAMEYFIGFIIEQLGMKVAKKLPKNPMAYYCDLPGNEGITGVGILETSHIAIHVWDAPEGAVDAPANIQVDIYTCSELSMKTVYPLLNSLVLCRGLKYMMIDRETLASILFEEWDGEDLV